MALAIQSVLWFHTNFRIISFSVKNGIGILIGIALNPKIAFSNMDILAILIILIQEREISFHLLVTYSMSLINAFQSAV